MQSDFERSFVKSSFYCTVCLHEHLRLVMSIETISAYLVTIQTQNALRGQAGCW